jgi:hypothetical protein
MSPEALCPPLPASPSRAGILKRRTRTPPRFRSVRSGEDHAPAAPVRQPASLKRRRPALLQRPANWDPLFHDEALCTSTPWEIRTTFDWLLAESDVDGLARDGGAFADMVDLAELKRLSWVDLDDPSLFDAEIVQIMGQVSVSG